MQSISKKESKDSIDDIIMRLDPEGEGVTISHYGHIEAGDRYLYFSSSNAPYVSIVHPHFTMTVYSDGNLLIYRSDYSVLGNAKIVAELIGHLVVLEEGEWAAGEIYRLLKWCLSKVVH